MWIPGHKGLTASRLRGCAAAQLHSYGSAWPRGRIWPNRGNLVPRVFSLSNMAAAGQREDPGDEVGIQANVHYIMCMWQGNYMCRMLVSAQCSKNEIYHMRFFFSMSVECGIKELGANSNPDYVATVTGVKLLKRKSFPIWRAKRS